MAWYSRALHYESGTRRDEQEKGGTKRQRDLARRDSAIFVARLLHDQLVGASYGYSREGEARVLLQR